MCGAVNPNFQENGCIVFSSREGSERYMLMITLVFLLNIFLVVRLLMDQCHSFCHHELHTLHMLRDYNILVDPNEHPFSNLTLSCFHSCSWWTEMRGRRNSAEMTYLLSTQMTWSTSEFLIVTSCKWEEKNNPDMGADYVYNTILTTSIQIVPHVDFL